MYEDYKSYYYDAVVPAFENYLLASKKTVGGRQNIKGPAMKAAETLFHLRDYLKTVIGSHFSRKYVGNLCHEFDIVGDVFNASKHEKLDRSDRLIDSIMDVKEIMQVSLIPRNGDQDSYTYIEFRIEVFKKKDDHIDLLKACTTVFNFWSNFLTENKLLDNVFHFHYQGDQPLPLLEIPSKNIEIQSSYSNEGSGLYIFSRKWSEEIKRFIPYQLPELSRDGAVLSPSIIYQRDINKPF